MKLATFLVGQGLYSTSYAFVAPESSHAPRQSSLCTTVAPVAETVNPRLEGLSLMLDDGTRKSHSMAQNSQFVTGFFRGLADRDSYKSLLTGLWFVYESMEKAMDETSEERVKEMDSAALRRMPSLKKDMEFFYGDDCESRVQVSAATKTYVARIQEIAETKPYLMVAHQYTRYLGDLFGGQMMGGMASRSLGLENGDGTQFYTFENISDNKLFITEWYQRLNDLELTKEQKEEIVDEANLVFQLNIDLLQELEGSPLKAMLTLAINSLKEKHLFPFLS